MTNVPCRLFLSLMLSGAFLGFSCGRGEAASESSGGAPSYRARRPEYERAIRNARSWLDRLEVDTVELARNGVKGKKKYVDQHLYLHTTAVAVKALLSAFERG